MTLKGGKRGHRRLLLLLGREEGLVLVPLLPFNLLVLAVILRYCLLCGPNSSSTAATLPQEPPPQPSLSAASAKAPKSLLEPAVPSASVSSALPSIGVLSLRVGVIRWRRVCQTGDSAINLCGPLLRARTAPACASAGPTPLWWQL